MTAAKPQRSQTAAETFDEDALAAIRELVATEARPEAEQPRRARPNPAPSGPAPAQAAGAAPEAVSTDPLETLANLHEGGLVGLIKEKITSYRPTVKHIVILALVLLVVFRPWVVLGIVFLTAFVVTGVFLILGYDGFWRRVMGVARWHARRHPSRSVEIHRKLDGFAMRFDAFLDRFPEGSVDGLYLPDFGDLAAADARHDEALDRRFDNLRENNA